MKYLRVRQWYTDEEVAKVPLNEVAQRTKVYARDETPIHCPKWTGEVFYAIREEGQTSTRSPIQLIHLKEKPGENFISLKYCIVDE